jgi:hypothetical protein
MSRDRTEGNESSPDLRSLAPAKPTVRRFAQLKRRNYRSGGGAIGSGAPPTEIGLVGLGARFATAAGRGGTTGWPEIEF